MSNVLTWTVAAMTGKVAPVDIKGLPSTVYKKK